MPKGSGKRRNRRPMWMIIEMVGEIKKACKKAKADQGLPIRDRMKMTWPKDTSYKARRKAANKKYFETQKAKDPDLMNKRKTWAEDYRKNYPDRIRKAKRKQYLRKLQKSGKKPKNKSAGGYQDIMDKNLIWKKKQKYKDFTKDSLPTGAFQ